MNQNIFSPADTPNLREIVFEKIKDAIITGLVPAGARLSETDISKQFDVSRTPVREAIRQLAETGLVTLTARKGAYVLLPTPKDVYDLFEIRTALEFISVEHICVNPPEELLREMRKSFEIVSNDWDAGRFMEMDEEFHSELTKNSHNNFLNFMFDKVGAIIQICRHYAIGRIPKVSSSMEHIAIIDAILRRDPGCAREAMRAHLQNTRDGLLEYISAHPEVSTHPEGR
jgi:DNA-binding GntR family transcriptional regulator